MDSQDPQNPVTMPGDLDTAFGKEAAVRSMIQSNGGNRAKYVSRHRIAYGMLGGTLTFLLTVAAYITGIGASCSLSEPNVEFAISWGATWGIVGGMLVGLGAALCPTHRTSQSLVGTAPIIWAVISGFIFFVWTAMIASC